MSKFDPEEAKQRITEIISEHLGLPIEEIVPEADFFEDLNAQNLEIAEIILEIEDEFKIKIPEEEKKKMKTINDLLETALDQIP